ncbi:hypothetical protein BJY01DRAFT_246158 [Aspergillus pseudoustus]|uniref:WD40-repeat-containing domain protein n=1 Tax=Aspergillus pseudoustus TaxID=1810923 RepID=A0ABR4K9G7_9EURO
MECPGLPILQHDSATESNKVLYENDSKFPAGLHEGPGTPLDAASSKPIALITVDSELAETFSADGETLTGRERDADGVDDGFDNLWGVACARLREEEPELMDAYASDLLTTDRQPPTAEQRMTDETSTEGYHQERRLQELTLRKLDALADARWKVTIGGKEVVVRDEIANVARKVLSFKDTIGVAVMTEPHAALAWTGVLVVLPLLSNPATQWEDAADGLNYIADTLIRSRVIEVSWGYDRHREDPSKSSHSTPIGELRQQIRTKLVDLYCGILRYQIQLASHCARGGAFRLLRDIFATDDWEKMRSELEETVNGIHESLRTMDSNTLAKVDAQMSQLQIKADKILTEITKIDRKVETLQREQLLAALQYAEYAAFDAVKKDEPSPARCYDGTRQEIMEEIESWVCGRSDHDKCIFWLSGMAGTGKSTIARTVGDLLSREHYCLGASFFFSRGRGLRAESTAFITTLALQLAAQMPEFAPYLAAAVGGQNRVGEISLSDQWQRLILEPLSALSDTLLMPVKVAFIVDALDECHGVAYVHEIVQLLSRAREMQRIDLRIFVTSRTEAYIVDSFRDLPGVLHRDLSSDQSRDGSTERDISRFMRASLKTLAEYHSLGDDWPEEKLIQGLIVKADRLFVYAATACRYLQNSAYPDRRLVEMLDTGTKGHSSTKALDDMYLLILSQMFAHCTSEDRDDVAVLFQQVVGTIVTAFEPLSSSGLASLFSISSRQVAMTLRQLHSLLHVPDDEVSLIEVFHLSFRDFIVNPSRCIDPQLRIEESQAHETLFLSCVDLMTASLRRDMCDLGEDGALASTVPRSTIDACIPPPLQYACLYFGPHIVKANLCGLHSVKLDEFLRTHFLHWLEVLSLLGRVGDGVWILQALEDATESSAYPTLHAFLNDAKRFLLHSRAIIEAAPLQVYGAGLVFSPRDSLVRQHFIISIPDWIASPPEVASDWSVLQAVDDISISPDSSMIVSGSGDQRVRLWDVCSGRVLFELEGHQDWIDATAFSPLGDTVASGSGDRTVRIWDVETGHCRLVLHGHKHSCASVAFSPDGKLLASASYDRTVRVWDTSTGGTLVHILDGHNDQVRAVRFSPDGRLLASGGIDRSIHIWNVEDGSTTQVLHGHRDSISSLSFAPQGSSTILASGSDDNTIRLWDLESGASRVVDCHGDRVHDVAVSPNGKFVATASADRTVKIWDLASARVIQTLEGHSDWVTAVVFSWDSTMVVSASVDRTIRLWDVRTGDPVKVLDNSRIPEVLFTTQKQPEANGEGRILLQPTERFVSKLEPLFLEGDWITHGGRRLLFLPAEYRPYS